MLVPVFDALVFDPTVFLTTWVYAAGPTVAVTVTRGVTITVTAATQVTFPAAAA